MGCWSSSKKQKATKNTLQSTSDIHAERTSDAITPFAETPTASFPRWSGGAAIDPSYLFSRLRQAQEIKNQQLKSACVILKQTFDSAVSKLDEVSEHDYKVVTMLLQHMRDALTEWTHAQDDSNLYDIPLQEIEMKANDANVDILSSGDEGMTVGKFSLVSSTSTEDSTSISHIFVDPQFLYEKLVHAQRLKQADKLDAARKILRSSFDSAIQDLDALDEKYFAATTALMQYMRNALTEWTTGNTAFDIPIDSISEDDQLKPFLSQHTIDDRLLTFEQSQLKRNGR